MIQKIASSTLLDRDETRSSLPFGFHSGSVNENQTDLPSTEFRFEQITQLDRLETIRPEWERLLEMAVEPNVFYQPEFLIPSFREFANQQTSILAIWSAPRVDPHSHPVLCGLIPLQLRRSVAGVPCRVTEFWKHDHVYLTTPLIRLDVLIETWQAFVGWIDDHTSTTLLHIPVHAADGVFHRMLTNWLTTSEKETFIKQRHVRALFMRDHDVESFLQRGLSRKKRHESKRALKRIAERGKVQFSQPSTDQDIKQWSNDFLDLEYSSWKGESQTALTCDASNRRFWFSLTEQASLLGRLMPLEMKLDGKLIAAKCNLLSVNGGFAFKIAYDPQHSKHSPGTLLEIENINRLHKQKNISWMDSCASANHPMIDSLWPDRRIIESVYISTGRRFSKLATASLPFLAWIRRIGKR